MEEIWANESTFPWLRPDYEPRNDLSKIEFTGFIVGELKADTSTGELIIVMTGKPLEHVPSK